VNEQGTRGAISFSEYGTLDGLGLAELIRTGEVSAAQVAQAAVARAREVNPYLNAVIHPRYAEALAEAGRWETRRAREARGPFPGVPFLLKDLLTELQGHPITSGSRLMEGFRPTADTELVRRYRTAGLVILGSTNTPEFGLLPVTEPEAHGATRNPWDPDRTPGGSSGGSAAAVAAGIVPLAGGGDGGGSLRIPASCCGVFGLKPTRGRTPTGPDRAPPWRGFAVQHVLTRSVRDSASALDWISPPEPGAPSAAPPPRSTFLAAAGRDPDPLRVAWTDVPLLGSRVSPESREALEDSIALLEDLGHRCEEVRLPLEGETFARSFVTAVAAELAGELDEIHRRTGRRAGPGRVEATTWALALVGRSLPGHRMAVALQEMERQGRQVAAFLAEYDVLVTPTLASPPLPVGALKRTGLERLALQVLGRLRAGGALRALNLLDRAADDAFDFIPWLPVFNVTGQPAMSVPLHWPEGGLPMGTHVVARFGDEETLFSLAGQLERARPWAHRFPAPGRGVGGIGDPRGPAQGLEVPA
jgi:amidase